MHVDVTTDVVIDRAPSRVSSSAADPNHAPAWYVSIKSVEWRTPPRLAVGSRIAFVAHFLGRRIAYVYDIVEFHSGERLVMRTADGPFPMETTYAWHQTPDGGTHMTRGIEERLAGFPSGSRHL